MSWIRIFQEGMECLYIFFVCCVNKIIQNYCISFWNFKSCVKTHNQFVLTIFSMLMTQRNKTYNRILFLQLSLTKLIFKLSSLLRMHTLSHHCYHAAHHRMTHFQDVLWVEPCSIILYSVLSEIKLRFQYRFLIRFL